jgi:phosphoglycolate phosphatase
VSGPVRATLACCELIGTLAADGGITERAFAEACATQGVVPGTAAYAHAMVTVHQSFGQPPVEVFRSLFPGGEGRAEAAALSFERSFRTGVERSGLSPLPGAEPVLDRLRESGLRICVLTGLPRRLLTVALDSLRWWPRIDLALCPDDVPRGFPWPDLMLGAMLRLGVTSVREAAFTGGSASGVRCGRRSGAGTVAGVLSGGHTADRLRTAGASHVISTVAGLPALLGGPPGAHPGADTPEPRVPLERRSAGL